MFVKLKNDAHVRAGKGRRRDVPAGETIEVPDAWGRRWIETSRAEEVLINVNTGEPETAAGTGKGKRSRATPEAR